MKSGKFFWREFDDRREVCENEGVNQNGGFQSRRLFFAAIIGIALLFPFVSSAQTVGKQMLRGHVPPAVGRFHLRPVSDLPTTNHLNLAIGLPLRNQDALNKLLQEIYDPASTNYHRYLTPEQFTEQFGPTEQDYAAVVNFAKTNGLTVTATYPNRTLVDVSGNTATVEKVFHVALRVYRHPSENRNFFAPDSEPSVDLAVPILHVSGLDNYSLLHPKIQIRPAGQIPKAMPNSGSGPSGTYRGNDFRAAYLPGVTTNQLSGAGQTIGLLEFEGYYSNDIAIYENQAGLPNVSLTNVLVDGFSGNPSSVSNNAILEVSLDIEMAISMAPGISKIIVYEAPNTSNQSVFDDIINRMATDNLAKQLSCSWGNNSTGSPDTIAENSFKQMAVDGQSFFNASGDSDAFTSGIPFPSESTNITQVGGTTLTTSGAGGSWVSETVWNWDIEFGSGYDGVGSGGGVSANYPIPVWQQGINMMTNNGSTTFRNVPDVALTADNIYVIANNNHGYPGVGGTSCAAPLWAGFTALINQQAASLGSAPVGFLNPAIYAIGKNANYPADFHDITTGNNFWSGSPTNFPAVAGYDLCTGWGTPNGMNLINTLVPPDTLIIIPPSGFNAGGPAGGAFSPNSQIFLLTNSSATSFTWSLINTSSWLNASMTNSALAANATTNVTITLTAANANSLAVGTYAANVKFTNWSTHVVQNVQFTLQVFEPLIISPANGFIARGAVGGPFDVTAQNFILSNSASASLNWRIANTSAWLNVSPVAGSLAGGAQINIAASLNSTATNLVSGIYNSTVFFTNQTSGIVQNRQFTLSIGQSIIQNGGFETGDFTGWTLNGDGFNANYVDGSGSFIAPHSGTYCALLGEPGMLAYLSQNLPTLAGQSYLLSLWLNSPNVTPHTPNEFSVAWNGGTLFDKVNIGKIGWTNLQFIVTATNSSTMLQFGARDDNYYLGLDDVSLVPIPTASFQTAALTAASSNINFAWNSLTGLVYQVQFKTNLLQTNWLVLKSITATNTTTTFVDTNPVTTLPQKFYRLQLLP
ncbi:MAG TPA: protease pro-enzyme activation domain-containing protein [Dongiaceae bacterium]|jgi:hypothetical protein|nr:protease pro-enzyme activation domain-containing protein [Dongiaceae bacterium]